MTKHEQYRKLWYEQRLRMWEARREDERKFVEDFWKPYEPGYQWRPIDCLFGIDKWT